MERIKSVLETKFERVVELVKEWQDLGMTSRTSFVDTNCRYDIKSKEWVVEVLYGEERDESLEKALDKQIKELETDEDYLYRLEVERKSNVEEREV